ncbi:MAG: adenylate/guanylate cyclase domain-containing protein [Spirochaetes bacterium]|nr:adenylate/guanylate cyclase domain-containing protein [Spirochaetota bacterium]
MNILKTWTGLIERGCHLYDSEEAVKLRKIQNTLILVLIISFGWSIVFEALLGLHMLFVLRRDMAEITRMFLHYVPPSFIGLGIIVLCLYLQKNRKGNLYALVVFYLGIAWNLYICISLSFDTMFYLIKLAFMPLPLVALSARSKAQKFSMVTGTMAVVGALIADFAFHHYNEPLCPIPAVYSTYLLVFALYLVVTAIIIIFYYVSKITDDAEDSLFREQDRSERLLLNILPVNVAQELKHKGYAAPVRYDLVTIMLTDIAGFTKLADTIAPEVLVRELDGCFSAFDALTEKYRIEKLKTLGDAYLCAGGVPAGNRTNAIDMVLAALEIRSMMARERRRRERADEYIWDIRIGISTGPVVAGVIGEKKFTYDVWGDAVNEAGILEMYGKIGEINISRSTYELVKELFNCRSRGKVGIGGGKYMHMYFVKSIKKEYSLGAEGKIPNDAFMKKYHSVRKGKGPRERKRPVCFDQVS